MSFILQSLSHLIKIGCTVIFTFLLLISPCFFTSSPLEAIQHILHRMFPWDRGLFEDKVASVWCTLHNLIKLNQIFTLNQLKLLCLLTTFIACLYSLYLVWKNPSLPSVCISLFITSLSFFLFSYHGFSFILFLISQFMKRQSYFHSYHFFYYPILIQIYHSPLLYMLLILCSHSLLKIKMRLLRLLILVLS